MSSLQLFFLAEWRKHIFSPRKEKKKERKSGTKEEQSEVKTRNSQRKRKGNFLYLSSIVHPNYIYDLTILSHKDVSVHVDFFLPFG